MANQGFIILCISNCIGSIGATIIAPVLPIYVRDLGASGFMLGVIFSIYYASMAIGNPIIGRLSDRIGKKVMISLGFGIVSIVAVLYVLAKNPAQLIIIRFVHGIAAAMIIPIIMAFVGEISHTGKEGLYMGTYGMMGFLGIAVGPFAGGRIVDALGSAWAFYAFGALSGIVFFLTLFLLPNIKDSKPVTTAWPLKKIFASRTIKGLMVFNFISSIAMGGLIVFLPLLAKGEHLSTSQIGILVSVFIAMAGLFQVPFGWLANRYNRVRLIFCGTLSVAIAIAIIPMAVGFMSFLILSAIIGISTALAGPASNAVLVEHSRTIGMGFVVGSMNSINCLGMAIGPIVSGIAMDQLGIGYSFYICSFFIIIGSLILNYYTKEMGLITQVEFKEISLIERF